MVVTTPLDVTAMPYVMTGGFGFEAGDDRARGRVQRDQPVVAPGAVDLVGPAADVDPPGAGRDRLDLVVDDRLPRAVEHAAAQVERGEATEAKVEATISTMASVLSL
jgi:hypothetical protein